jgi:predicted acetylornithine/succinylornithine family transaminase
MTAGVRDGRLLDRGTAAVQPTYPPRPLAFVRGAGTHLFDDEGREYLDLVAGLAVVSLGHGHPAPAAALAAQQAVLGHVSNLFWSEPGIALAERLAVLTGLPGARSFFCNSGAEANEAAIKLARRRGRARGGPDRHEIVCLEGAFHGRTFGALAATWAQPKKEPFEPLPAGFLHVPPNDVEALAAAVGPRTAAVLVEPIQGEGGVYPLELGFLQAARELCDQHDAMLLFDEVQTGVGRCGAWFAFQRIGVEPDAIALAKGLGSGLPVGALVAREVEDGFAPGDHGTTFGGSPAIAAAALAVLEAIQQEGLVENADRVGEYLARRLRELPGVAEVRGLGLLLAAELRAGDSATVAARLLEHGVLVNAVTPTALRMCPPLCLSTADADRAVTALAAVL